MPYLNHHSYSDDIRHFYKNPLTGEFEPMQVIKHVDVNIDESPRYDEPRCNSINVRVDGLETYDQVKDLIGYVCSLWEKK